MASKHSVSPPPLDSNHDLWVIPPSAHSQWFARIDWYLNWQMSKGLAYQRRKPSVELLRVLEDAGTAFQLHCAADTSPLLVASSGMVGSERCVVIEYGGELGEWLESVHQVCDNLKCKRTRVFLPRGITAAQAQTLWKKQPQLETHLEFSTDEDTTP
jgi:hypothetical protein